MTSAGSSPDQDVRYTTPTGISVWAGSMDAKMQRRLEDAVAASGSQVWVTNQTQGRAVRADSIVAAHADARGVQIVPAGGREPIQIVSRAHGQPDLP